MDTKSLTDAFVVLYDVSSKNQKSLRGRTETVVNSLNPEFVTEIQVDFMFESSQTFLIEVYDLDDNTNQDDLSKQQLVGTHIFKLSKLVTSKDQKLLCLLENEKRKNSCGEIVITAEVLKNAESPMLGIFNVSLNVKPTKSEYFFSIYRCTP